jgi:hypothetical protein
MIMEVCGQDLRTHSRKGFPSISASAAGIICTMEGTLNNNPSRYENTRSLKGVQEIL